MKDHAKQHAERIFHSISAQFPSHIQDLNLESNPTARRTYFYGALQSVLRVPSLDQFTTMYLLNLLRREIGMSPEELAGQILNVMEDDE